MIFIQIEDKTQVHHETIYVVSSVLYPSIFFIYIFFFQQNTWNIYKNNNKNG